MKTIDLSKHQGRTYKVLSGVTLGEDVRKVLKLDSFDKNDEKIIFSVPDSVYSLNSSFFAGLFQKSLRVLGERNFREKYQFKCNDTIRANIEDGIFYVLNTADLLGE